MAKLTEIGKTVIANRISQRNEDGEPYEDHYRVFDRVSRAVAQAEVEDARVGWANKFYKIMHDLDFLPNSPTLCHAGTELGQLAACYVLPVPDSMEGIFDALKSAAMIHKSGGGTGFSFSNLRPSGARVSSTHGVSSGPVEFMKVFDAATAAIKQGGTRRGANMGILSADHPDILEFISCKSGDDALNNFNISVSATDEFMKKACLKDGKESYLLEKISRAAWKNGDPGMVFIDGMNNYGSNPLAFISDGPMIEATNPCGEQPLFPNESCTLGSINLANFADSSPGGFDYDSLREVVEIAVRFLDNVIDCNKYPLAEVEEQTKLYRRIGLGVMGWADALLMLKIRYGSVGSIALADEVMKFISEVARSYSRTLAEGKGSAPYTEKYQVGQTRNIAVTTIAPTGTISMIAGVSSGIEPNFAWEYERRHYLSKDDPTELTVLTETHPLAALAGHRNVLPDHFVVASDIPAEEHVQMQAAFQHYVDNAVSKTINLPHTATWEEVQEIYIQAWGAGCKGITVYRDGSRELQVLTKVVDKEQPKVHTAPIRTKLPPERQSLTHKFQVGEQEGYVTVGLYDDGTPGEVFLWVSKQGSTVHGLLDVAATLFSYCLQYGIPIATLTAKLKGTRFDPSGFTGNKEIPTALSIIDYIARWLELKFPAPRIMTDELAAIDISEMHAPPVSGDTCPDCGIQLVHQGGCEECQSCGWGKC